MHVPVRAHLDLIGAVDEVFARAGDAAGGLDGDIGVEAVFDDRFGDSFCYSCSFFNIALYFLSTKHENISDGSDIASKIATAICVFKFIL